MNGVIREVMVVGSGIAAAIAALSIARRIPGVRVTLLDLALPPDPIDDLLGAARPSIRSFHRAIGVDETEILLRTGGGLRFGSMIDGIAAAPFFRGHGRLLAPAGATPLHLLSAGVPLGSMSPAAMLASHARVALTAADPSSPFAGLDYGLQLDLPGYGKALAALGRAAGIIQRRGRLAGIEQAGDTGAISALHLADGERLMADLYIDATGSSARLRSVLPVMRVDWSTRLPIDHLSISRKSSAGDMATSDRIDGHPNGWEYLACAPSGKVTIRAWSGRFACAPASQPDGGEIFRIAQGRLTAPFSGNVVAIGAAAVTIEPLAATGLHAIVRQVDRLVSLWPGSVPTPSEVDMFNRRAALDADRMLDFVQLHYRLAARSEPFWRASSMPDLSDDMSRDLALFSERGRLTPHDEDGFEHEEWLQLITGLGIGPRRKDPLAAETMPADFGAAIASARAKLEQAVKQASAQGKWLHKAMGVSS